MVSLYHGAALRSALRSVKTAGGLMPTDSGHFLQMKTLRPNFHFFSFLGGAFSFLMYNPGCPPTWDPPASASPVLRWQMCTNIQLVAPTNRFIYWETIYIQQYLWILIGSERLTQKVPMHAPSHQPSTPFLLPTKCHCWFIITRSLVFELHLFIFYSIRVFTHVKCVCAQVCANLCMCVWWPKVNIKNFPWSCFCLVLWGMVFQS